jgi:hypothetical protein
VGSAPSLLAGLTPAALARRAHRPRLLAGPIRARAGKGLVRGLDGRRWRGPLGSSCDPNRPRYGELARAAVDESRHARAAPDVVPARGGIPGLESRGVHNRPDKRFAADLRELLCPWRGKAPTHRRCREPWEVVPRRGRYGRSSPTQPPTPPSPAPTRLEPTPTPPRDSDSPETRRPAGYAGAPTQGRRPSPRRPKSTRSDGLTRRRLLGRQLTPLRELPLADRIADLHHAAALAARAATQAK